MKRIEKILQIPPQDRYQALATGMQIVANLHRENIEDYLFNFNINELNVDQLNEMVDNYRRPDGQYVYKGQFMHRQEVYESIRKNYCTVCINILDLEERVKYIKYDLPSVEFVDKTNLL